MAKAGSELKVKITLTNLLDKDLLIDTSGQGKRDYTIHVLDKDGREPLEARQASSISRPRRSARIGTALMSSR